MANLSQYYPAPIVAGTTLGTYADGASAAHVSLANTFTQNQTLDGTNNVAPNQTAASSSSIMTRALVDAQLVRYVLDAPQVWRDLTYATASYSSGLGAAQHAGPIDGGRVAARVSGGDATSRAGVRINRLGPWNGVSGNNGLNWGRAFEVCVVGSRLFLSTSNVTMFLALGVAGNDTTLPASGSFVGLEWTTTTNANLVVAANGAPSNVTSFTTAASAPQFAFWISNNGNGTGDIFYVETINGAGTHTPLVKPSTATASWTGGPTGVTAAGISLTFGIVGAGANTGFNSTELFNVKAFMP
jgi:hypothetical protein